MQPQSDAQTRQTVTVLLAGARQGDPGALERLLPLVYTELLRRARACMRRERPGHTLQPTALVHEVYLRLTDQEKTGWQDRRHFFAIASTLMRRVLVNHARDRKAAKRGGGAQQVPLADAEGASEGRKLDIIALDEALEKLEKRNPRACRIVEMRFFAGLTAEEAAEELGIDVRTAERDWTGAKAFLKHELCS